MRIAFLGPAGTFSAQAVAESGLAADAELLQQPTIHAAVMAVQDGSADRAIVPIENSIEGSVNETLDALVHDAPGVQIVGESVLAVTYSLIAAPGTALEDVRLVLSHPQPLSQCAAVLRELVPHAETRWTSSTAEAVRQVCESSEPWAALGTASSAALYGGEVLRDGLQDEAANATRFLWLAPAGVAAAGPGDGAPALSWKSSVVFSGDGDQEPGWLLRCLSEFAERNVNLTRIESRPARQRLGHYLFLLDLEGRADQPGDARAAVDALRPRCAELRLLGTYPGASR